jgi:transcription antitermination factor NusG
MPQLIWSLATTAPNREKHVGEILVSIKMEHRIFLACARIVRNGQVIHCMRPVFPGYVFIRPENQFGLVQSIIGILGFVRFGGSVADVTDTVMALDSESDGSSVLLRSKEEPISKFAEGEKIRIKDGVMTGYFGVFSRMLYSDKAIVLLEWMGRQVPFTVRESQIELREEKKRHGWKLRRLRENYSQRVAEAA